MLHFEHENSGHLLLTFVMLAFSLIIPYFIWVGVPVLLGQALFIVKGLIPAVDDLAR